jgi:hypothetical protein
MYKYGNETTMITIFKSRGQIFAMKIFGKTPLAYLSCLRSTLTLHLPFTNNTCFRLTCSKSATITSSIAVGSYRPQPPRSRCRAIAISNIEVVQFLIPAHAKDITSRYITVYPPPTESVAQLLDLDYCHAWVSFLVLFLGMCPECEDSMSGLKVFLQVRSQFRDVALCEQLTRVASCLYDIFHLDLRLLRIPPSLLSFLSCGKGRRGGPLTGSVAWNR